MNALLATLFLILTAWAQDEPAPMSFDDFEFAAEELDAPAAAARRAKRSESISLLTELSVASDADSSQRADVMLRLAHLLHQQGRETHDRALTERAAKLYARLLADFPEHAQVDHITFHLGFALASLGEEASIEALSLVVKRYPGSEYVPHAMLHLGEVYFARGDYLRAAKAYERAEGPEFPFADFAVYKHAWALHRGGDAMAAIDRMAVAIQQSRPGLVRTAIDALVYWSEAAGRTVDAAMTTRVVKRRFGDCRDDLPAHQSRLAAEPMAAAAFDAQLAITTCAHAVGNPWRSGRAALEARFGPGSAWWKLQDGPTRRHARQALREARAW
ncbi:MAG: tetratricopeptide repeat protein [Deltaproteobacteria bacterium]|nr:MAG: tetratricopeptide repeat protein [Deltaproteobacteria bacterium]